MVVYIVCRIEFFLIRDGYLNIEEFRLLTRALFRNDRGKIYHLEEQKLKDIFVVFDTNDDGRIDKDEFAFCWNHWIKIVCLIYIFLTSFFI